MLNFSYKYLKGFFGVLGRQLWLLSLVFALVAHIKLKVMCSVHECSKPITCDVELETVLTRYSVIP